MHLGDAKNILRGEVSINLLHSGTILLKEPGLYCFLLGCRNSLPQEFRKLASVIEETDAALALSNDDLQDRDNQIQAIHYENVALQAHRDVYQAELQRC